MPHRARRRADPNSPEEQRAALVLAQMLGTTRPTSTGKPDGQNGGSR